MRMFKINVPRSLPANDALKGAPEALAMLRRIAPKLLPYHPDDHVLIHDGRIVGRFDSFGDGIREGYKRFGLDPFLVQKAGIVVSRVKVPKSMHSLRLFFKDLLLGNLFIGFQPRHA